MIVIGIDPGAFGGIAWLGDAILKDKAIDMPKTERDILYAIRDIGCFGGGPVTAYVETVNLGFPGSSKSAVAKLNGNFMACRMAVIASNHRLESVRSQDWQKALGIPKRAKNETPSKWKNRLKAKAQQLFPAVNVTLKTADALLIAEYGRRKELTMI